MRILTTVAPLMYRESLTLQRRRPDSEVLFGVAESLDGEVESFRPHLLIHSSDTDGVEAKLREDAPCRIEILYKGSMGARVNLAGEIWEIKDVSTVDLLELADRTEKLMLEGTVF